VVRQLPARASAMSEALDEANELRSFAEAVHRKVRQRIADDLRVSYGRPGDGAAGVARSYREARTTEALARRVSTSSICSYRDLRVFAAIQEAAMSPAGQAFAADVLSPLRQTDGQTGNLEEVVLAYIEESGNLNATARRLHLHRNTMLYKLDRASRALQMDVRTTDAQFMVWLAHHIRALGDVVGALDQELAPPT
jgi:DNA-binding PucR family transcriptional regulator